MVLSSCPFTTAERNLVRSIARFTPADLDMLRGMARDRRVLNPKPYAYVRDERGMEESDAADTGRT